MKDIEFLWKLKNKYEINIFVIHDAYGVLSSGPF